MAEVYESPYMGDIGLVPWRKKGPSTYSGHIPVNEQLSNGFGAEEGNAPAARAPAQLIRRCRKLSMLNSLAVWDPVASSTPSGDHACTVPWP